MDKQRETKEVKINLELSLGMTSPIFDEQRTQRPRPNENLLEQQRELLMSRLGELRKERDDYRERLRLLEKRPIEVKEDYQDNFNYPKKRRVVNAMIGTENKVSTDQTTPLEARVELRTRSQGPTISDGCSWRKYGQKLPKGSPHPRAYYQCTMVKECPVVKQVEKCAEDETIEVTTYKGKHNHFLPPTAKMMAKITSLAESMILTDSKSSADELNSICPGLSEKATLSPSGRFPTIRLDLTNLPNHNPLQQNQFPQTKPNLTSLISQSIISGLQTSTPTLNAPLLQSLDQNAAVNDIVLSAITSSPNFTTAIAIAVVSLISGVDIPKGDNASSSGTVTSDDHT